MLRAAGGRAQLVHACAAAALTPHLRTARQGMPAPRRRRLLNFVSALQRLRTAPPRKSQRAAAGRWPHPCSLVLQRNSAFSRNHSYAEKEDLDDFDS